LYVEWFDTSGTCQCKKGKYLEMGEEEKKFKKKLLIIKLVSFAGVVKQHEVLHVSLI
jgi:hypothetical protein